MKITNNNIRAAKRLYRHTNGTSYSDLERVRRNRTHEKSEKATNERESDSPAPTP